MPGYKDGGPLSMPSTAFGSGLTYGVAVGEGVAGTVGVTRVADAVPGWFDGGHINGINSYPDTVSKIHAIVTNRCTIKNFFCKSFSLIISFASLFQISRTNKERFAYHGLFMAPQRVGIFESVYLPNRTQRGYSSNAASTHKGSLVLK